VDHGRGVGLAPPRMMMPQPSAGAELRRVARGPRAHTRIRTQARMRAQPAWGFPRRSARRRGLHGGEGRGCAAVSCIITVLRWSAARCWNPAKEPGSRGRGGRGKGAAPPSRGKGATQRFQVEKREQRFKSRKGSSATLQGHRKGATQRFKAEEREQRFKVDEKEQRSASRPTKESALQGRLFTDGGAAAVPDGVRPVADFQAV
jgi:hypothetical protein